MKKRHLLFIPVLASALLLAGCASDSKKIVDLNLRYMTASSAPVNATDQNAQAQLSEAATSVGHSLQQLSAVQMAKQGKHRATGATGLSRYADLNWNGPVQPVVAKIAEAANYHLHVYGNKPATAIMVDISTAKPMPLSELLNNVKYQAAGKATIRVFPSKRVIELRYNR